jgi:predicted nucleic acid-binding protein
MTTAIDTNVIVALWDRDPALNSSAHIALERAFQKGKLVISAPVFAELLAAPGRTQDFIDGFLHDTSIAVDWSLDEPIWRSAGKAFQSYADRRRRQRDAGTRRILADFLIGAHAYVRGYRLLALDERVYRAAFPRLNLEIVK